MGQNGEYRNEWKEATTGQPQGSAFGLMRKQSCQDDLVFNIRGCQTSKYADNHQIYCSRENGNKNEMLLNQDIKMASQWCKENHMKANKNKYQAMTLQNIGKAIKR